VKNADKTHCLRHHEFTEENTYTGRHLTARDNFTPHRVCRTCRLDRERLNAGKKSDYAKTWRKRMNELAGERTLLEALIPGEGDLVPRLRAAMLELKTLRLLK